MSTKNWGQSKEELRAGDQWVIPNTDLLEDLADEYSFDEAGKT